ncbi:NAD-binding protein [Halomonas sp. QX-2]|uniref:NAD-binding protein n=1 Tax=Vreelandella sedimenti TaxID=2729618 RepID=A0A7Z0N8C7_9GAMM|nr:NAD-binding protein [Halomonas sedimenti]NYT72796.1 NAD-binding protein [Halomonas sedimenti]
MANALSHQTVLILWGVFLALVVYRYSRKFPAWTLLVTALFAILLRVTGFFLYELEMQPGELGYVGLFTNALFKSIQLLFMGDTPAPNENILIQMSRLSALATVFMLTYEAIRRLFADSIQRVMLQLNKQHVVICGLGQIGYHLVCDLRSETEGGTGKLSGIPKVVVVEPDRENPYLNAVRDLGVTVVHADAINIQTLKGINAHKARDVFFLTGKDEVNIEGACKLDDNIVDGLGWENDSTPDLYVHLRHADLGGVVENRRSLSSADGRSHIKAFNVIDRSVRDVVGNLVLPWRPRTTSQIAHFVIVGFGEVGQRLALRLAELAHFENGKRSRMTIVHGSHEHESVRRFRQIYPRMMPSDGPADAWMPEAARDDWSFGVSVADRGNPQPGDCGVAFVVNGGWTEMDAAPDSDEFVERIVNLAGTPDLLPVVFICRESDELNCSLAHKLRTELDQRLKEKDGSDGDLLRYRDGLSPVPIFSYVPRRPMLTRLVDSPDLISFGASDVVCTYKELTRDLQRPLAEALAADFHREYEKRQAIAAGEPTHHIEAPTFSTLPAWERQSNLSAAAHLNIKLAALDMKLVYRDHMSTPADIAKISSEQREHVARMEHSRWLAERLLNGWTFGERDNARKRRLSIVDWDSLKSDEPAKDSDQIDRIIDFCSQHPVIALTRADGEPDQKEC